MSITWELVRDRTWHLDSQLGEGEGGQERGRAEGRGGTWSRARKDLQVTSLPSWETLGEALTSGITAITANNTPFC